MKYLFMDLETSGLPVDFSAKITDTANWPRIVQIAAILTDESGGVLKELDLIVQPSNFKIENAYIHGITQEIAAKQGVQLSFALRLLNSIVKNDTTIVCHNVDFDIPVLMCELYRVGLFDPFFDRNFICTQKQTAELLQIPYPAPGFEGQKWKWPSLAELHRWCGFGEVKRAHTAFADARACMNCFFFIKKNQPGTFASFYGLSTLKL